MDGLAAGVLIAQRYRLSAPLGAGAQGSVWEAVDTRRGGALCAIKFAHQGRQQAEVETLLAIGHPSLPRALDYGAHGEAGGTFLVLERVVGAPLDGGMDARVVIRALADVASALAALHDAGLVHGDVKPANVLVGPERAYLVDLGLVAPQRAGSGAAAGTLAFMAPETLTGERGPASDLYALGVTAALVLTGRHPLVDDPTHRNALLTAIARRAPARDAVIAALPPACRDAVALLLSPDPERRARSARAWLGRLARDAASELSAAQRAAALAAAREPVGEVPLVGRDAERERAHAAVERALGTAGSGTGGAAAVVGLVVHGPPGAGRRRLADDAVRATQIAWAARGALPEVVDELPAEITRPTILRRIDAAPDEVRALAAAIERLRRFAAGTPPIALVASCTEAVAVPSLAHVALGPLDRAALAQLLEALAGRALEPAALDAWAEVTAALAGSVATLASALEPGAVAAATRDELRRALEPAPALRLRAELGRDARTAALLLAAAEEPLALAEIAQIAPLAAPAAAGAVAEVVRRGLAIERDGRVRLVTPLALDALDPAERARLGAALEAYCAAHAPGRAALRARAALLRGDRDAAREHAEQAARAPNSSPLSRVRWLELARASATDPAPLALRLSAELLTLGEPRRALAVLAELPESPEVLAQRADALRRAGAADEARALARALEGSADEPARVVARVVLARDALDRGDARAAVSTLGPLADGEGAPAPLRARALEAGALAALALGDATATRARIERALALVGDAGQGVQRARLRSLEGMAHQQRGAHEAGLACYRDAHALATAAGDAHGAATYAVNLGAAELECGALGEAAHWLARGARALARLGRMGDLGRALANLASLHAFIGDRASALEYATRAEHAALDAGDRVTEALARLVAAEVSLEGAAAGDALAAAAEASAKGGDALFAAEAESRAAVAYARAGDLEAARQALARADGASAPLRALAALELALAARAEPAALGARLEAARAAVASERTIEHELHLLALAVRVAAAPDDARRARAAYDARVDALAATLPEALATIFRDAHALPAERASLGASAASPAGASVPPPAATSGGASTGLSTARDVSAHARWRRLAEITADLNSERRLRPLLEKVMDAIVELTGAARGFLLLRGPDGALRIRTARNIGQRDLGSDELALSRSVAERVAATGEPLVTVDATSDRRLDAFESVHAMRLRSILVVPLLVHGEVTGTIYVDDRFRAAAFGDDALEIAREFAEAAAVAIHNARTQALLRRALRRAERLSRELKRRVDAQSVELEATRRALTSAVPATRGRYDEIVGRGQAMLRMLALIDKVAPTAMSVLLHGENGSGKELVARAIHANSPRAGKPFVAENCGAIPETLLESVLFGHTKGAFTGADRARAGLFEVADGGTLFFDEIGEMSPNMQAKLLRVLQDGEVRPVGGERSRKVDVRVIAATHRDLAEMVRRGQFREDLYYRLAVMVVPIPPLRQRREDLPSLVAHFIEKHARRAVPVERRAMARLVGYAWPGNVRQLENEVMRACVLADGMIREDDLSPALCVGGAGDEGAGPGGAPRDPLDLRRAVEDVERQLIERALREHGGNQSRAARALGLSRFGLQKKLKRLAIGSGRRAGAAGVAAPQGDALGEDDAGDDLAADEGGEDDDEPTRAAASAADVPRSGPRRSRVGLRAIKS